MADSPMLNAIGCAQELLDRTRYERAADGDYYVRAQILALPGGEVRENNVNCAVPARQVQVGDCFVHHIHIRQRGKPEHRLVQVVIRKHEPCNCQYTLANCLLRQLIHGFL